VSRQRLSPSGPIIGLSRSADLFGLPREKGIMIPLMVSTIAIFGGDA